MKMHETTFYDDHPFDWTEGYTRHELEATLAPLLASFIQRHLGMPWYWMSGVAPVV